MLSKDDVDSKLDKLDGLIVRPKNTLLCRHGGNSKCQNCLPIDPFDENYLKEKDIKHMSFHSYLRKIQGSKKSALNRFPLENVSCKIKPGCTNHKPWPQGICDKCRPTDVTLNRQRYRHIDNISFENNILVSRFIDFWRTSGFQRIGFLFGYYEELFEVPLGIRGIAAAIYEPPQVSMTQHSVELLEDDKSALVDHLADQLGLKRIGWMFTDLKPDLQKRVCVQCTRNKDTYFLSAEECITAGYFQSKYLNATKYCTDGYFGSKFVTVILTGDAQQQIQPFGYQVSNQCAALVEGNCLVPTKDAPELAYVRESTPEQYAPAVNYMAKDEYGNDVRKAGQPLPVEYLIVDVPASMPKEQRFTFTARDNLEGFTIENRRAINQPQDAATVTRYCAQFADQEMFEMLSDFHFLLYLLTNETLTFSLDDLKPLCEGIRTKNRQMVDDWIKCNEKWTSFKSLSMIETNHACESNKVENNWSCKHCTFVNPNGKNDCEVCSLPKEGRFLAVKMSQCSSNSIYHERQSWQLCALHSLNNLFQGFAFNRENLDDICKRLSPESGFWNPHKNCMGLGNYDINVVISALNTKDCTAIWFDKRKNPEVIDLSKIVGFIANVPSQAKFSFITIPFVKRSHWIAIREIDGTYYNLDSKLAQPQLIGDENDLMKYLTDILLCKDKELFVVVSCETERNGSWNKEKLH